MILNLNIFFFCFEHNKWMYVIGFRSDISSLFVINAVTLKIRYQLWCYHCAYVECTSDWASLTNKRIHILWLASAPKRPKGGGLLEGYCVDELFLIFFLIRSKNSERGFLWPPFAPLWIWCDIYMAKRDTRSRIWFWLWTEFIIKSNRINKVTQDRKKET